MSSEKNPTTVGSFTERVATALRRRVGTGRAVSVEQLARAFGRHADTVRIWCSGTRLPPSADLEQLIRFFDASFANEIFAGSGCVIVKLPHPRAADAVRRLNQAAEDLIAALA